MKDLQRFRPRGQTWLSAALVVMAMVVAACDPRPYAPPEVREFVHTADVPPLHPAVDVYDETQVTIKASDGLYHVLTVKVADDPVEHDHGLQEVPLVPAGTGLLLFYDEPVTGGITMQGVLIGLDVAFVDERGEIFSIFTMAPCRIAACDPYDPEGPYQAALQVPAGWFDDHKIVTGDSMAIDVITPADADPV